MGSAFLAGQGGGGMSDKKIKEYLNSTVGTDREMPLDKLIPYNIAVQSGDNVTEFNTSGTYVFNNIPFWATRVCVTACAGGGSGGWVSSAGYSSGAGGGGGGQAILNKVYSLNGVNSLTIVVGKGGGCSINAIEDGTNTTIEELNIVLNGGKHGNSPTGSSGASGGAAGGAGGGNGGAGGYSSSYESGYNGAAGIAGVGGLGSSGGSSSRGGSGGGGGSLGSGGNGKDKSSDNLTIHGVRGGGGGGNTYEKKVGKGGDGYVKLEWLL